MFLYHSLIGLTICDLDSSYDHLEERGDSNG